MRPRWIIVNHYGAGVLPEESCIVSRSLYESKEELLGRTVVYDDEEILCVDLDNLETLHPSLQHQIKERIASRAETYILRKDGETFEVVLPGTESQMKLNEGDRVIKLEDPKDKIND